VTQQKSVLDKALDTFVYAPVGVALFVKDSAPTFLPVFIARGKGELDGRRREVEGALAQAKSRGEATVAFGPVSIMADVMARLDALRNQLVSTVGDTTDVVTSSIANTVATASEAVAGGIASPSTPATPTESSAPTAAPAPRPESAGAPTTARPDVSALAIANYDELSASQVVERLDGLDHTDLEAIREYETATRGRRTILGRIETLTA